MSYLSQDEVDAAAVIGDPEAFRRLAEHLRAELAHATGTPLDELRPQAAESLAVLRVAGSLIHPALRDAMDDPTVSDLGPLIRGRVTALIETATRGGVPAAILWGNVASVIESSARMIAATNPAQGARVFAMASSALHLPELIGRWTGQIGETFRRTSCCQVTGPDPTELRCADCVRDPT